MDDDILIEAKHDSVLLIVVAAVMVIVAIWIIRIFYLVHRDGPSSHRLRLAAIRAESEASNLARRNRERAHAESLLVQDILIVRTLLRLESIQLSQEEDAAEQVPKFPRHHQGPITILVGTSELLCFSRILQVNGSWLEPTVERVARHPQVHGKDGDGEVETATGNSHNTESRSEHLRQSNVDSARDPEHPTLSSQNNMPNPADVETGVQNNIETDTDVARHSGVTKVGSTATPRGTSDNRTEGSATGAPTDLDAVKSPETCCSICLEDFRKGDLVVWSKHNLDCPHIYHRHCLMRWLKGRSHVCPTCRRTWDV